MESVFLLKNILQYQFKVAQNAKKNEMKNCEKKMKKIKKRMRKATLNISNNSPRILGTEKTPKKKNSFLPKMSWIRCLTIRNVVLAPKLRRARFFRMRCARLISCTISFQWNRPPGKNGVFSWIALLTDKYFKSSSFLEFRLDKFVLHHGRRENTLQIKFMNVRHNVECLPCCFPRCLVLFIHKFGRTQLINISGACLLLQCGVQSLSECTSGPNNDVCSRLETSLASNPNKMHIDQN